MTHSLPYFYGSLLKVKTVENAIRGLAMKDFVKGALVIIAVLALVLSVRVAFFAHLHGDIAAVNDAAPFAAADK
jgi:hypothetical protein